MVIHVYYYYCSVLCKLRHTADCSRQAVNTCSKHNDLHPNSFNVARCSNIASRSKQLMKNALNKICFD